MSAAAGPIRHLVGYVFDPVMTLHCDEEEHPECPERILEIFKVLLNRGLIQRMTAVPSREATLDELTMVHTSQYLQSLEWHLRGPPGLLKSLGAQSDSVYYNQHTLHCAKLAAGSTIELTKQVVDGKLQSGVAIVRPPGHHALSNKSMGFCIYNNVALASFAAIHQGARVLVVDIDIHHGNGTQSIFQEHPGMFSDEKLMFFSIHRHDGGYFYPRTGDSLSEADNHLISVGLDGYIDDKVYLQTLHERLVPHALQFRPNLIVVSAGFDAAEGDPLGNSHVTPEGFREIAKLLQSICPKIVYVLEGGYNLSAISNGFANCVEVLLNPSHKRN
jgi:acetoin utilization deacetylase AcuC-like enzyme